MREPGRGRPLHTADVDSEVGSGILDVREISLYALAAFVGSGNERRAQLDMLAAAGQVPVKVPVVDRSHRAAHDLHVLLRHRLLLQPHGFEGYVLVLVEAEASDSPVADGEHERDVSGVDL